MAAKSTKRKSKPESAVDDISYWSRSQRPLASLLMLLPLVVLYEVGAVVFAVKGDIVAHAWLNYKWLGMRMDFLPGLLVVVVLLCWHIAKGDRWEFEPKLYLVMALESLMWAIPLYVILGLIGSRMAPGTGDGSGGEAAMAVMGAMDRNKAMDLYFSIGAGVYEELVFRLMGFALLHWLLVDVVEVGEAWGQSLTLVATAVAFSLYHFYPNKPIGLVDATLFFIGGIFLGGLYMARGFGITAGTHAIFDVLVVLMSLAGSGAGA